METKLLTGTQSLFDIQDEWNALWLRAEVTYPGAVSYTHLTLPTIYSV